MISLSKPPEIEKQISQPKIKEWYPKISKLSKEVRNAPFVKLKKIFSSKAKELYKCKKEFKLEKYDHETIYTQKDIRTRDLG